MSMNFSDNGQLYFETSSDAISYIMAGIELNELDPNSYDLDAIVNATFTWDTGRSVYAINFNLNEASERGDLWELIQSYDHAAA